MIQDQNDLVYFAPAARALGVPKSKLSRRIALLEDRLGVRLLQRSTRRFSVTEIGESYHRLSGGLVTAGVAALQVEFMQLYPRVEIQLASINGRVDVVAEGYDIAIRARAPPLEDSSLVTRELAQGDWYLVASPKLCERYPVPALGVVQLPGVRALIDFLVDRFAAMPGD